MDCASVYSSTLSHRTTENKFHLPALKLFYSQVNIIINFLNFMPSFILLKSPLQSFSALAQCGRILNVSFIPCPISVTCLVSINVTLSFAPCIVLCQPGTASLPTEGAFAMHFRTNIPYLMCLDCGEMSK